MRRSADRIRHAVSFEIIGLMAMTPLGAWLFDVPMLEMGVLAIVAATLATLWNYIYNLIFDHTMLRMRGDVRKQLRHRILHAVLFELGLLIVLIPIIAWYLSIGLMQAFIMDVAFSAFYLVYAFGFNWAYDIIFPVPNPTA